MKTFEKLVISGIILISFNLQARNVKLSSLKHYLNPSPKNDLSQVMILDRYNLIISKNSHNVVVDINQFEANEICCMHNNKGQKECEQLTSKEKFELPVFLPDILTLTKKFDPLAHIADSKENCQRWARKKINDNEWLCYDPRIAHQQWDFSVDGNLGYVLYWSSTPDLNGDIFYIQGGIVYSMSPDTRSYNTPSTPYEGASKNYFTFSARCGRHAGLGRTVLKSKWTDHLCPESEYGEICYMDSNTRMWQKERNCEEANGRLPTEEELQNVEPIDVPEGYSILRCFYNES